MATCEKGVHDGGVGGRYSQTMPPGSDNLPELVTSLTNEGILSRLDAAAKKGKLPGFESKTGGYLFAVDAFGAMFDYQLMATTSTSEGRTRVAFALNRRPKMPAMMGVAMVATVWPGLPMTDSMLRSWIATYDSWPWWVTYAWYIPLGILPLPWMWIKWHTSSKAAATEHALEQIEAIAGLLEATKA